MKTMTLFGIGSCRENALAFASQGLCWPDEDEAWHYMDKIPKCSEYTLKVWPLTAQLS